jgi:predicted ester cyclase
MSEENKAVLRRAKGRWNHGDLDGYLELYDPNVVLHGFLPGLPAGLEGARQFYSGMWAAFPSPRLTFEDMISEEDRVAVRFTMQATQRGNFMGIPPTGQEIALSGITILRFAGNKCVERWNVGDMLGLMQQLGVVPGQ